MLKILTVGDGNVGKTSMLLSFTQGLTPDPLMYEPTVYVEHDHSIIIDQKEYEIQLLDTTGQEDYDRLRPIFYNDVNCFIVCFSVDSPNSYANVSDKWAREVKYYKPNIPVVLVATKSDLRNALEIKALSTEEGLKLKRAINAVKYIECSALTKEGIQTVFEEATKTVLLANAKKCCVII